MTQTSPPDLRRPIAGLRAPDTKIAQDAVKLAWESSSPMLFNHVMRSYYLGRLAAGQAAHGTDDEVTFLSSVLHDLGLTDAARGPRRFEIEGADAARRFLEGEGFESVRSWLVWDTIALHPWSDINLYKEPEARIAQLGIMADAAGVGVEAIGRSDLAEILAAFPRLGFKTGFVDLLIEEANHKPDVHVMHPVHMIAHHCCYTVPVPDARAIIGAAPFPD